MLDLDQCQKFPRNHLYPTRYVGTRPDSAVSTSPDSSEENEFDFFGAHKYVYCGDFHGQGLGGSELEFQNQAHSDQDFGGCSPPNIKDESSPLLPYNHQYSNPSPTTRRQEILQSRRELMEMIQDMPESCYELSLKDIVDEQGVQGVREETDAEKTSFDFHTEPKIGKQNCTKKKSYNKRGQISRTSSMESETFLLKIFFPTFRGSKKKAKAPGNCSKVSLSTGVNKKSCRSFSAGSTSGSNSSTQRFSNSSSFLGCWFFNSKKSKSKIQRACSL